MQAFAHATTPRQPLALLAAHRTLANLNTAIGRYRGVGAHLDAAFALADACGAPYERALTLFALAQLHLARGERSAARVALTESRTIGAALGARPLLARADALNRAIAATPPPAGYPGGLSAREVEVIRLVADGLTDAQIAERLFLSPRTVSQHLRSIYNKLGVASRVAAARYASEHGLA